MRNIEKEYILRRFAWNGNLEGVKKLIKEGVDPFAKDKECWFKNQTALQVAKLAGHHKIVLCLENLKKKLNSSI